jgi:FKBP-type peptidyl-prolyl cis-trans isomerase
VTGVIPGFTEGLQMMKKGGTYRLKIPPSSLMARRAPAA